MIYKIKKTIIVSFLLLIINQSYVYSEPPASNDKVSMKMDKSGIPYIDTYYNTESISQELVVELINSGNVEKVYIDEERKYGIISTIGGTLISFNYSADKKILNTLFENNLAPIFKSFPELPEGEKYINKNEKSNNLGKLLLLLPFIIVIGGIALIYEKRQSVLRGPAPKDDEVAYHDREGPAGMIPKVSFDDVAGCEEAIDDLKELVEFLKAPERFEKLGAKVPRGAILVGPPGTGKTLLARAVAGEAKVAFFAASGSDFVEMYVGVGPLRVRELFSKARAAEKAIVFIDEIDAVAKSRAMSVKQNANDERENTLNALLHELDGFNRSNVILIAATNRVDILDPAILRPGRLDRKVNVPNPDRRGREKILKVHVSGKPLAKDVDLSLIAKRTPGMSGADLAQIANEAAIEAARKGLKNITADCFSSAVALVAMGRARKSALITDQDRLITAYHEAGHTICAMLESDAPDPVSVSITPRGHAGGITWMSGTDDQYLSRKQASAQLVVAMGGRAGEEFLMDGEFTQGPSSDLEKATQLAIMMVTKYGMSRRGLSVRAGDPDAATSEIVEELLNEALRKAREIVNENKVLFLKIIENLLDHETLEYLDLIEIKNGNNIEKVKEKNKKEKNVIIDMVKSAKNEIKNSKITYSGVSKGSNKKVKKIEKKVEKRKKAIG
jgi:cell division protease FtsH